MDSNFDKHSKRHQYPRYQSTTAILWCNTQRNITFILFIFQGKGDDLEIALNEALELGYRHIDTASRYQNEEIIGNVLKKWFNSGNLKREDVFITTKLAPSGMHPDNVEERLKESLRKLQLDYVDLYLIHFPIPIIETDTADAYGDPNITYLDIWKVSFILSAWKLLN